MRAQTAGGDGRAGAQRELHVHHAARTHLRPRQPRGTAASPLCSFRAAQMRMPAVHLMLSSRPAEVELLQSTLLMIMSSP